MRHELGRGLRHLKKSSNFEVNCRPNCVTDYVTELRMLNQVVPRIFDMSVNKVILSGSLFKWQDCLQGRADSANANKEGGISGIKTSAKLASRRTSRSLAVDCNLKPFALLLQGLR